MAPDPQPDSWHEEFESLHDRCRNGFGKQLTVLKRPPRAAAARSRFI